MAMDKGLYSNASAAADYAEGRLDVSSAASYVPRSQFVKMVVLETITDPNVVLQDIKKLDYWGAVLGVSNMKFSNNLPRNTIIAQRLGKKTSPMFVFPFFPSHLSLPCKAGETMWVMFENPSAAFSEVAYWFCKITEPHTVDDVNHTHAPRIKDPSFRSNNLVEKKKGGGKTNPVYELRNGEPGRNEGRNTIAETVYIPTDEEDVFERLTTATDAARLTQYEAVPRFRKRPSDVVLEGSNNTLIVLGTDRTSAVATYQASPEANNSKVPTLPSTDTVGSAGSIDLVAGRGQIPETLGIQVDTTSVRKKAGADRGIPLGRKEIAKSLDSLSEKEGDPDLVNDRSRVLVSQRTNVDKNFKLDKFNKDKLKVEDSPAGDAAVVIKSDKVRIIARSDVQIVVTSAEDSQSPDGKKILKESTDTKKFASITIKKSGDIVFTPAETGVVKLGGDDANLAILCVTSPNSGAPNGVVQGAPITNNFGGINGAGGNTGQWATKVLIK